MCPLLNVTAWHFGSTSPPPSRPPLRMSRRLRGAPPKVSDLRLGSRRRSERLPCGRNLAMGGRLCLWGPRSGSLEHGPSDGGLSVRVGPVRCRMSCTSPAYWPQVFSEATGLSCGARKRSESRHFSIRVYLPVRPTKRMHKLRLWSLGEAFFLYIKLIYAIDHSK